MVINCTAVAVSSTANSLNAFLVVFFLLSKYATGKIEGLTYPNCGGKIGFLTLNSTEITSSSVVFESVLAPGSSRWVHRKQEPIEPRTGLSWRELQDMETLYTGIYTSSHMLCRIRHLNIINILCK